jgi:hypothetical protein
MIAGGSAPGYWPRIDFDPERVAPLHCMCDPFRVELCGESTVGDAPGYHRLPLQGTDRFSDSLSYVELTLTIAVCNCV